jgi:amino acid adenylation domain-containing protein
VRVYLLPHLLRTAAARWPDRPALAAGGEETSYAALEERSDRLAAALAAAGVGYRDRVGIYLPKGSAAAYVSIFAVLKLGAAYVPLDPGAPPSRVRTIAGDCALRGLVATAELAASLFEGGAPACLEVLAIDGEPPGATPSGLRVLPLTAGGGEPPAERAIECDLAYVLYTSGSTGRPKGVMVSHRGALAFAEWACEAIALRPEDRVAGVAELHFDLSIFDLFATAAAGGTLLPLPSQALLRPENVTAWLASAEVSVWYSTPSALMMLLDQGRLSCRDYPRLRKVLFAGEVFPTRHLRRLRRALPRAELYNLYGPTETNVCTWSRIGDLPADDGETIPIGRACAGTEVVALDAEGYETAPGAEGELWVRGPTVMRGYWGDAERTAAALRPLPRLAPGNDLWCRTGDLVHRDAQGDYHFHGRRDHMVKVRGYRVELGEVEAALYTHPEVRELAVVPVPGGEDSGLRLRAFVALAAGSRPSAIKLKAFLGERLPAYMIPSEVSFVDALPKTSTGKVDRQALARAS